MDVASVLLGVVAIGAGAAAVWALRERGRACSERDVARTERDAAAARAAELERTMSRFVEDVDRLRAELDAARQDRAALEAQLEERTKAAAQREAEFESRFRLLAQEVMLGATRQLKQDAAGEIEERRKAVESLVKPIAETLQQTRARLEELDRASAQRFTELKTHAASVATAGETLRVETGRLVQALRRPEVRGRYGEVQLQRVVELAGLRSYCDFDAQASLRTEQERLLRPDLVVNLPNGRRLAIDAKTNIDAYISAVEAPDRAQQDALLEKFADHVAQQADRLAHKQYAANLRDSLDFVVMFIPGDQFVDAALQRRPKLLEMAAEKSVVLASPSTLIGLLRAVHVGWREKNLSEQAAELFELGKQLHDRAVVALGHAEKIGKSLRDAVARYNDFVGSMELRMMPTLRRFEDAGASSERKLPELVPVETLARPVAAALDARAADDGALRAK